MIRKPALLLELYNCAMAAAKNHLIAKNQYVDDDPSRALQPIYTVTLNRYDVNTLSSFLTLFVPPSHLSRTPRYLYLLLISPALSAICISFSSLPHSPLFVSPSHLSRTPRYLYLLLISPALPAICISFLSLPHSPLFVSPSHLSRTPRCLYLLLISPALPAICISFSSLPNSPAVSVLVHDSLALSLPPPITSFTSRLSFAVCLAVSV